MGLSFGSKRCPWVYLSLRRGRYTWVYLSTSNDVKARIPPLLHLPSAASLTTACFHDELRCFRDERDHLRDVGGGLVRRPCGSISRGFQQGDPPRRCSPRCVI